METLYVQLFTWEFSIFISMSIAYIEAEEILIHLSFLKWYDKANELCKEDIFLAIYNIAMHSPLQSIQKWHWNILTKKKPWTIYSGLGICGGYIYTILCFLELVGNFENFQKNKKEKKEGKEKEEEKEKDIKLENFVISHLWTYYSPLLLSTSWSLSTSVHLFPLHKDRLCGVICIHLRQTQSLCSFHQRTIYEAVKKMSFSE